MEIEAGKRELSKKNEAKVEKQIVEIVLNSFELRPMPLSTITEKECQRRLDMCLEMFVYCYRDCHWSWHRSLDFMQRFLIQRLDGVSWNSIKPEPVSRGSSTMYGLDNLQKEEKERRLSALSATFSPGHVLDSMGRRILIRTDKN